MPLRKRTSTEADHYDKPNYDEPMEDKENSSSQDDPDSIGKSTPWHEKRRSVGLTMSAPMSPMKRHEAPLSQDELGFESPSAKRRSVHGAGGGLDFSIFESEPIMSLHTESRRRSQDDNDFMKPGPATTAARFSTIPRRLSSLRKSTLQQRQSDRPLHLRFSSLADQVTSDSPMSPVVNNKKDVRMSVDGNLPPMARDSPFGSQGQLLCASVHPLSSAPTSQSQAAPHPLSNIMTHSSSTGSVQDDSPTHEPVHRNERPPPPDFSKSLPVGALRPEGSFYTESSQEGSSQGSFATPGNYKNARPLPAAFMSTGLISKKNRNVDDHNAGLPKAHMPDTPCKRHPVLNQVKLAPLPQDRHPNGGARVSFGTPSTPFGTPYVAVKTTPLPFAKSTGLFGNNLTKQILNRKSSFASIEAERAPSPSPPTQPNSQSTEADFPPTPTKHAGDFVKHARVSSSPQEVRVSSQSSFNLSASAKGVRFSSSKLSPIQASPGSIDGDSDSVMEDSPSANLRPHSLLNVLNPSSFTKGRLLKNMNSPTPLSRRALAATLHSPRSPRAKLECLSPVVPRNGPIEHTSPHTPLEPFFPPDPSALSISGRSERLSLRPGSSSAIAVPETPTGPRDYFANFSNRPSLNLHGPDAATVDESLRAKFNTIEIVGTGEFSEVYRVAQPPEASPFRNLYSISVDATRSSSRSSLPEKIWAVKKSRYPYAGNKDRQRKIHEVDVLKALGHSDHVLTFVDSWEHSGHLYIQTEFCEEGTLDIFLTQVGLKARLDDFRIWKILLELSLGLRHIHDSGFIHLDLKPANVLITFEGVLKIADFGMATRWPARPGIEGEGDREYIGPEILKGQYDKPADIFALGLIMLETAGNVELPDNGTSWQKLRNGDMSDVPSLTWSSDESHTLRDATGNPILDEDSNAIQTDYEPSFDVETSAEGEQLHFQRPKRPMHLNRSGELLAAPAFMIDATHPHALDNIVRWMIQPTPSDRPLASEVLLTTGVQWAERRRRAGATVFEGNWGPADEVLAEDAEMIDV